METIENIKTRRSIRRFKDIQLDENTFKEIIDVTKYAPSWKNSHIARYYLINNKEYIKQIAESSPSRGNAVFIGAAPSLIIVTYKKGIIGTNKEGIYNSERDKSWQEFDVGLATQTLCLTLHEKGYGSVIIGIFNNSAISNIINLPEDEELMTVLPVGIPNEEPNAPKRKNTEELINIIN